MAIICFWFVSPLCAAERGPKIDVKLPFRENVTLPVDGNLLKRFGAVNDLLNDRRWNEAIGLIQEIVQTESKSLVLVQPGKVGGMAIYVNVASHCNLLLSRIPAEGREAYRRKVDPQARRWFENWQRTRDETELTQIVRLAFLSRLGDDALLALGEAAWDRGDFSAARLWWEQLKPLPPAADPADYPTVLRYPDTDIDLATVLARIILCSIQEAEYDRAEDELRRFTELYPLTEGWICGRQGRLVELVRQSLSESRHWKRTAAAAEVSTFGMSPERYLRIPESLDVGALRWVRSLPANILRQPSERLPYLNEPLSYHPVVFDKIVLVNDADAIRAWNILTGDPAWQSERRDPAVIYPSAADEPAWTPEKPCVGAPHYTMTIAHGRLYARMGSPVTCSSTAELRPEFASDLVCLELAQEGKLVWKIAAHELFRDNPAWRYEGSPVIVGGRAYVALCRRHPQLELVVACLDASDGRLLWQRPIGAFRVSVDDSHNRVSHLLLTAGGGRVFLSTDAGAIVAMDAVDGRLEWAISYESRPDEVPPFFVDSSRQGLTPAIFHEGLLFVAPNDSTSAYCIEADSGRVHWRHSYLGSTPRGLPEPLRRDHEADRLRLKKWRHLLGVVRGGPSGRLIVSGNSLSAIDVETGKVVWERGEGSAMQGAYGQGLIAGGQIFVPMRASIEIYNAETGEHLREVLLKTPDSPQSGGNLTLAGGILLVAQSNRLAAYCEYSRLKKRIENELTERPDDFLLRIQLAEVEFAEGHIDSATSGYRQALNAMEPGDPEWFKARRKLAKLLQETGLAEFARQNPAEALSLWLKAIEVTDDVTRRVDLIFDLAKADEALDKPEDALKRLQEILSNERFASVRRENLTAGHDAAGTMTRLIARFGRDAYTPIESEAAAELEQLANAADRHGVRRLIEKYPHAIVVGDARILLVQLSRKAGEVSEVYATLGEIERLASDDRTRVETTLAKIDLLRQARLTDSANRLWRTLSMLPSSMEIEWEGTKCDLHELSRGQVQHDETSRPARPSFLQRTWSLDLSSDGWVVRPECTPPSAEFETVLICWKHPRQSNSWIWRCLDWRTGQSRWEETAPSPIRIAAWTDVHLLIGTLNGWQARSAETGRRIWEQVTLAESTPLIAGRTDGVVDQTIWPALFDVERGLRLFDGDNGQLVANLKPEGRLHSVFGVSTDSKTSDSESESASLNRRPRDRPMTVAMQTVKPARTWCARAASPRENWSIVELAEGGELWRDNPVFLEDQVVAMTTEQHLAGFAASRLPREIQHASDSNEDGPSPMANRWTYNNFATGLGPPIAFAPRNRLLVVEDGSRLASFDPVTGIRKWSTGLVDFPMKSPAHQICAGECCLFATSQGTIRAISTVDGAILWERYLGETTPQWRTAVAWSGRNVKTSQATPADSVSRVDKAIIAAWPLDSTGQNGHTIRLCDAETGTISQQLQVEGEPQEIMINSNGFGVVWTSQSIFGLKFASAAAVAAAGRKPALTRP